MTAKGYAQDMVDMYKESGMLGRYTITSFEVKGWKYVKLDIDNSSTADSIYDRLIEMVKPRFIYLALQGLRNQMVRDLELHVGNSRSSPQDKI